MAKRGPKSKDEQLKVVEGVRKDRRATIPTPRVAARPLPPADLDGDGRIQWDRLCDELEALGSLSTADGPAIALYCEAYERWQLARRDLHFHGAVVETGMGSIKPNPASAMVAAAWNQMIRVLVELGLTPASRGQVGNARQAEKADALTAFLATQK